MERRSPTPGSTSSESGSFISAVSGESDLAAALSLLDIQRLASSNEEKPLLTSALDGISGSKGVDASDVDLVEDEWSAGPLEQHPSQAIGATATTSSNPAKNVARLPTYSRKSSLVQTHRTVAIFQESCIKHRYIRTKDIATIVERPERIRAIKTGVASAWARLENRDVLQGGQRWVADEVESHTKRENNGELADIMGNLNINEGAKGKGVVGGPFDIVISTATLKVDDPALTYIHPLPNPRLNSISSNQQTGAVLPSPPTKSVTSTPIRKVASQEHKTPLAELPRIQAAEKLLQDEPLSWPYELQDLCRNAKSAIFKPPYSEIPDHLPQGDLYLSDGSEEAIFGALGAVCEGVDRIVEGTQSGTGYDRAFVAIRPPGHHCCEAQPMGFCFVNNVAVAAAHAYQRHGIDRVIVLDIDLHHGNGTQDIVWRINEEANKMTSTASPRKGSPKKTKPRKLQIMYGSLHDVFSYPCEDGDPDLVQAASITMSGGHSQYISNVHLEPWSHESEFHEKLYPKYRMALIGQAEEFCQKSATLDDPWQETQRTMVIISAGFDASEHESAGMSRHRRNVPTSFFHRFSRDVAKFSIAYTQGRILSVLEGGYSDRALASGSMAMMVGLTEAPRLAERTFLLEDGNERSWWEEKSLLQLEKTCKPQASSSRKPATSGNAEDSARKSKAFSADTGWLSRSFEIFSIIEGVEITRPPSPSSSRDPSKATVNAAGVSRTMQLRERRPRGAGTSSQDATPQGSPAQSSKTPSKVFASVRANHSAVKPGPPPVYDTEAKLGYSSSATAGSAFERPASAVPAPKVIFTWKEGGFGQNGKGVGGESFREREDPSSMSALRGLDFNHSETFESVKAVPPALTSGSIPTSSFGSSDEEASLSRIK